MGIPTPVTHSHAPLHWLINTHCHSDHMGGNRAMREHYHCRVTIPAGEVKHVVPWTAQSCWSEQMDQYAEQFQFDDTINAGDVFDAGGLRCRRSPHLATTWMP